MTPEPKTVPIERVLAQVEGQRNAAMTQLAVANAHIAALEAELEAAAQKQAETEGD